MPQDGKLPTSSWQPGQVIEDQYQLTLAADAPVSSDYRYLLGLYQWQTGERLTHRDGRQGRIDTMTDFKDTSYHRFTRHAASGSTSR